MQEIDIKRGHFKNIEGVKLEQMMKEILGNVKKKDGWFVSHCGAMDPIKVRLISKTILELDINTKQVDNYDDVPKTMKAKNDFLMAATGFSAKERSKRLQKKAKQGK